jgi:2-amino-4-hydroxy-6-hydroxymethyldihydropteridine diphosphokinase
VSERALIALGSNVEAERHLPAAVAALRERAQVERVSSAWATAPVGPAGQPPFLNAAVLLSTELPPERLRSELLHGIERELGRVRTEDRYAPRTIDLDLTAYGVQRLRLGDREIPDPELLREAFLAVPAAEVAPEWVHPVTGETLEAIASGLVEALPADQRPRRLTLWG